MPRRKLSNEVLHQIALKYMKRSEFQRNDSSAYSVACRRGILDDICKHMESPYRNLSKKELAHIAKKYKNPTPQNVFYLVLKNMKKSKDNIAKIFGISKESLRSTEFRLNKKEKKKKTNLPILVLIVLFV